jgi:hypothetical protein
MIEMTERPENHSAPMAPTACQGKRSVCCYRPMTRIRSSYWAGFNGDECPAGCAAGLESCMRLLDGSRLRPR